jgi:histidine triad (HIT) family protein
LVIPRDHHENLYCLPAPVGHAIWELIQRVAMRRAYTCDGTSIRQHNEPAGGQDVWHLHVHVFARHHDDRLYENNGQAQWVGPR